MITFFVPGTPKPQGSKRAFINRKTGRPIITEQVNNKDWKATVQSRAIEIVGEQQPLLGPIDVELVFFLNRPKSHPKTRRTWPASMPDIDKLARAVLDALTAVCFKDDGQIVHLLVVKEWAVDDVQASGVRVRVTQPADYVSTLPLIERVLA